MKIAVTYDNGTVYPHFGMASCVKIYEASEGKIVSSEVVDMPSAGHSVIAGVIFGHGASVVICGNIKPGAASGLEMSGIQLIAGAEGSADEAVQAYLDGTLKHNPDACSADEECGHHDDEHEHN